MRKYFYHNDMIVMIEKYLALVLMDQIMKRYNLKFNIVIVRLKDPYINGTGRYEAKILEEAVKINGRKDVKLTFVENTADAKLTIKVNDKSIGLIGKMEGLTIIKKLGNALIKEIIKG